jgi:hypothetical protein
MMHSDPFPLVAHGASNFPARRLLDVVYGTTRGVTASLDERGEAEELITILEGRNPNTVVTDALEVLHGRWKLVYTTNTQTLMLLNAIQALPLVDIGDVYQVVDGANLVAHNKVRTGQLGQSLFTPLEPCSRSASDPLNAT